MSDPLTLYKLIVLYMLNRVSFPLTAAQISDFILTREYTNFSYPSAGHPGAYRYRPRRCQNGPEQNPASAEQRMESRPWISFPNRSVLPSDRKLMNI